MKIDKLNSAKQKGKSQGLIFVISGPSGSGKTTLAEKLVADKELRPRLVRSVSLTTRKIRSAEKEGRDYSFVSEKEFLRLKREKKILEWTRYLGYYYGTPKDFIEKQIALNRHIVLCLDLKGALRIKTLYPRNTVTIFVKPPSIGELKSRIEKRCSKTKTEEIFRRLRLAEKELKASHRYDYFLVNIDLDQAEEELKTYILRKIAKEER